jgi:hypothetical protein
LAAPKYWHKFARSSCAAPGDPAEPEWCAAAMM